MKVAFDKSFHKSLVKIKDKPVLVRVKQAILNTEEAPEVQQISNIENWKGLRIITGYELAITALAWN